MSSTSSAPLTSSSTSTFRPGRVPTAGTTDSDVGGVFNTPIFKGMLVVAGVGACTYGGYVGWEAYKSYKGKHDSDSQNDETATDGDSKKVISYSDSDFKAPINLQDGDGSTSTLKHRPSLTIKELIKRGVSSTEAKRISKKPRPAQDIHVSKLAADEAAKIIKNHTNSKRNQVMKALHNKRSIALNPKLPIFEPSVKRSRRD